MTADILHVNNYCFILHALSAHVLLYDSFFFFLVYAGYSVHPTDTYIHYYSRMSPQGMLQLQKYVYRKFVL